MVFLGPVFSFERLIISVPILCFVYSWTTQQFRFCGVRWNQTFLKTKALVFSWPSDRPSSLWWSEHHADQEQMMFSEVLWSMAKQKPSLECTWHVRLVSWHRPVLFAWHKKGLQRREESLERGVSALPSKLWQHFVDQIKGSDIPEEDLMCKTWWV